MRRILIAAAGLLVASCSSQLSYDLGKAEDACHDETWPEKASLVRCLGARERPVYDQFAKEREDLALQFDQGALTDAQYRERLAQVSKDLRAQVTERRKSLPAPP